MQLHYWYWQLLFYSLPLLSKSLIAKQTVKVQKDENFTEVLVDNKTGNAQDRNAQEAEADGYHKKFNVPSYLMIAGDWNNQGSYSGKPDYFISGSIKLD